MTYEEALQKVLQHEGGFVNHPRDPGGATNKGVTLNTYRRFKPNATVKDLKNISDSELKKIYRTYWDAVDADNLPDNIRGSVFDMAVNAGPKRAKRLLNQVGTDASARDYADARLGYYRKLNHFDTFGKGWTNRANSWAGDSKPTTTRRSKTVPDTDPVVTPQQREVPRPLAAPPAPEQAPQSPQSFGEAFKRARAQHGGAGGEFTYKGKQYHTGWKEEENMNDGGYVHMKGGGWLSGLFNNDVNTWSEPEGGFQSAAHKRNWKAARDRAYAAQREARRAEEERNRPKKPKRELGAFGKAVERTFNDGKTYKELQEEKAAAAAQAQSARESRGTLAERLLAGEKLSARERLQFAGQYGMDTRTFLKQQGYNDGGIVYANDGWFDDLLNWQGISGDGLTLGQKFGQGTLWGEPSAETAERNEALSRRPGIRDGNVPEISLGNPDWGGFGAGENTDAAPEVPQPSADVPVPRPQGNIAELTAQIMALPPEEQDAALNALDPATQDAVLDHEEKIWRNDNALQTAQLQAAVTAPDAQGAGFIQDRVDALTEQADSLGVPPEAQGVGADVQVGGADGVPRIGTVPELAQASAEGVPLTDDRPPEMIEEGDVGAVPGLEKPIATGDPREGLASGAATGFNPPEPEQTNNDPTVTPETEVAMTTDENNNVTVSTPEGQTTTVKPEAFSKASNFLKDFLGIEGQDLKKAAGLYLVQRAMGISHAGAMRWAGAQALNQANTRDAKYEKAATSGDYTEESLAKYRESNDPADLKVKPETVEVNETGDQKEFFDIQTGRPITARKVKVGNSYTWLDKNNQPVDLNNTHDDPSRSQYTSEYREVIKKESDANIKHFESLMKENAFDGQKATGINAHSAGKSAAKWARKNGVPHDAMGQMIENAYNSALKDGKEAKSIEAYLNDQFVRTKVGDPSLFQTSDGNTADPVKVNALVSQISGQLSGLEQYQEQVKTLRS